MAVIASFFILPEVIWKYCTAIIIRNMAFSVLDPTQKFAPDVQIDYLASMSSYQDTTLTGTLARRTMKPHTMVAG